MSDDARTLLGGVLVGDASRLREPAPDARPRAAAATRPRSCCPRAAAARPELELPDDAGVCSCNNVSAGTIRGAVTEHGCTDLGAVKACTKAGTSCGSCLPLVKKLMTTELTKQGIDGQHRRCASTSRSAARSCFDAVRVSGVCVVHAVIERFGTRAGRGCDICRPTVASILATTSPAHVLEGERAALQDTNDHVMANLQKDGSYSVVPRIPGGEVTPEGLIAIGEVAQGLRAVHQDHRRPADRPVRRPDRPAAGRSGSGWSTPASSPATRTASRCAP